jgi:hypothetical protein
LFIVGAALWVVGALLVYKANTVSGALLVLAGAVVCLGVVAWWRGDRTAGIQGVIEVIGQFLSRG